MLYTYADYLEWDEGYRAELINGEVFEMGAPTSTHQRISMRLSIKIGTYLEGKRCEVFAAPYSVRLFPEPELGDNTVLEPDLVVICDTSKIDEHGCNGAPDLVIEILSPSNGKKELRFRRNLFLQAGMQEYWLIDPVKKTVKVYLLENGRYDTKTYSGADSVPVSILPLLSIDLKALFA
ncbi:hypothetical protein FACS1894200_11670 [Spirochaetia bacterium]|nr:hypothetical protein FACS1894200_11670 [Spirochaetia bacterium]